MTIYEPMIADGFEFLESVSGDDDEEFYSLDGSPKGAAWRSVAVEVVSAEGRARLKRSDFPWITGALVLRERTLAVLRGMLEACGELLPLTTTDGERLWAYNVRSVDALDEAASEIVYFPNSRRIMTIKRSAFVASAVEGVDLFRLPHRGSPTYVSRRFRDAVVAHELVGLDFTSVWTG